jgi:polysaccharide export outer membrane protein
MSHSTDRHEGFRSTLARLMPATVMRFRPARLFRFTPAVIARGAVPLLLALTVAGCGGHSADPTSNAAACPANIRAPSTESLSPSTAYVIGAGDQLGITVYRAPELSVPNLPVRPDGRISMPLIPDILAAGKTSSQLGKELEVKMKEYVQDPIVTVMITGFIGPYDRQVKVIGEATEPAAIPYRDGMTVLDVMIATKGLTRYASGNSAVIVRKLGDRQETIKVRLSDLLKDGDICQNVEMRPGDTLIIPQTWF